MKYKESFYCLNCFHSYTTKKRRERHYNLCKDHDFCYIDMSNRDNKVLKYNHGEKSINVGFIIQDDLEFRLKK